MPDPTERPTLPGDRLTLRPGGPGDAEALHAILAEDSVRRWWGEPEPPPELVGSLSGSGGDAGVLLVIEVDGEVAGGIQYGEEADPMYRHANIDVFLSARYAGRGLGTEAVARLARWLVEVRGHHRLTIDPAADNAAAIHCYTKAGFRPVGRMRAYERAPDGTFRDGLLMDLLATDLPATDRPATDRPEIDRPRTGPELSPAPRATAG